MTSTPSPHQNYELRERRVGRDTRLFIKFWSMWFLAMFIGFALSFIGINLLIGAFYES